MAENSILLGINNHVAQTVNAYLDYCARVMESSMNSKGYSSDRFKQLGDELVLTPEEIVELVDRLQVAYKSV